MGRGEGKSKNMPHHKARSGAWRRKIKKYAPLQSQKRGMEKENCKICPTTKPEAGHGEGKLQKMPHYEAVGGAWRRETAKYALSRSLMRGVKNKKNTDCPAVPFAFRCASCS